MLGWRGLAGVALGAGGLGMRLLVVRHAIAEERAAFARGGRGDEERPLTPEGRRKMRSAAAGLRRLVGRPDVLASSPLVRAVETAEILAAAFGEGLKAARTAALEPGKPVNAVLHWAQGQPADATVAVVGHEPQLGALVSWLLSGEQRAFVELRKGSACLLAFPDRVRAGRATLLWMLKPGQLRDLGK